MEHENIRPIYKKKNVTSIDKEFMFQPEPERSNKGYGSFKLGPRVRVGATLVTFSNEEEERISPRRSPSSTSTRDFQERMRLPQTLRTTSPTIYVPQT